MLHDFAQQLFVQHEAVVAQWLRAVRADPGIPTAQTLSETELRDHLDGVLKRLGEQLARALAPSPAPVAEAHGVARSRQRYRVDELVREVAVLRSSLLEFFSSFLHECRQIATEEYLRVTLLVHRFFDEICSESVAGYVREREEQSETHALSLRQLNETLEKTNREYEAADAYRRRTLRTVAHEMATPVNALGLGVAYLSESESSEERVEARSLVERTLEHLRTMLDQLAELARGEGGMERLQVREFPVRPLFEYAVHSFEPVAAAKRLDFSGTLDPRLELVRSDENKVQRMAVNLLSNAMKYCETGRVSLHMRVLDEEWWALEVEDTGCGIPPDDLERIFGEFERLPHHVEQPGLGLGLSIVRMLAQRLGGSVSVESTLGRGSLFRVTLPLAI
jgi:signal transduction histidine kinase